MTIIWHPGRGAAGGRRRRHTVRNGVLATALLASVAGLGPVATSAGAASGDFKLDFVASAPSSYDHTTGGGAFDDRTIGRDADVVESLEGGDFACGDIVTFFTNVSVADTEQAATDGPQTIELDYSFLMDSTGQSGAAIGDVVNVGVNGGAITDLIAGEDTADQGMVDDGGSAATLVSETKSGAMFSAGSTLDATVRLTDLERDEEVIVRVDVRLFCQPDAEPTGNLQASLSGARLTETGAGAVTPPDTINAGSQTIPFKQVGDLAEDLLPAIGVVKTANPTHVPETGDDVMFTVTVTNNSTEPFVLTSLVDDRFGNLAGQGTCVLPRTIPGLGTSTCTFTKTLASDSLTPHVDVVTASGTDEQGNPASATDDATVTFDDLLPSIEIVKTATPTLARYGDAILYSFQVRNLGFEELENVVVTDDRCSPVNYLGGDADSDSKLDLTETWSYSCLTTHTGSTTNVATATGSDDDGNKATDTDTETVAIINPAIVIDKEASAATVPAGGQIVYTYRVTTPGDDPLADVSVVDDRCGPVTFAGGDADGDTKLDPSETWYFNCTAVLTTPGSVTNIATATGTDSLGHKVSATDTATVEVTAVLGVAAERGVLPRTGGTPLGLLAVGVVLLLGGAALVQLGATRRHELDSLHVRAPGGDGGTERCTR